MVVRIVVGFKIVYIDHDQRERTPPSFCCLYLFWEVLVEIPAIIESCKFIRDRETLDFFFQFSSLRDIFYHCVVIDHFT